MKKPWKNPEKETLAKQWKTVKTLKNRENAGKSLMQTLEKPWKPWKTVKNLENPWKSPENRKNIEKPWTPAKKFENLENFEKPSKNHEKTMKKPWEWPKKRKKRKKRKKPKKSKKSAQEPTTYDREAEKNQEIGDEFMNPDQDMERAA